jgi:hypothetical protein
LIRANPNQGSRKKAQVTIWLVKSPAPYKGIVTSIHILSLVFNG